MQVETFEQQVERHPEACDEAERLIGELGLGGQQAITSPNDGAPRCPYRQWTAIEHEMYSLLCPSVDKVEDYCADTIPLRVLQVLAHAKMLGIYESFEVWHAASPAVKDPILVGVPHSETWRKEKRHLLARWGSELDEFPAMVRQAAAIKRTKLLGDAAKLVAKAREFQERVMASVDGTDLMGVSAPCMYGGE